jgi:hypothetical protein
LLLVVTGEHDSAKADSIQYGPDVFLEVGMEFNPAALDATVFNPSGPCQEPVHLTGSVHLVTDVRHVHGVVEITLILTPVDVHGVGALTGAHYVATGAVRQEVVMQSLPGSVQVEAEFDFIPLGPCRLPSPKVEHLTVAVELGFNGNGDLTPETKAGAPTIPIPPL